MISAQEKAREQGLRGLCRVVSKYGFQIRREKLARGNGFRVKSGNCHYRGEKVFFLDRRLPADQQVNVLVDYLSDQNVVFSKADLDSLASSVRKVAGLRLSAVQNSIDG